METLNALRAEWQRPGDESSVLLKLHSERETKLFEHAPIKHPPIRKNEEFLAVKAKHRPVIVVSRESDPIESRLRAANEFPESFLVVPVYTLEGVEGEAFDPEFVERVKFLVYHQFFYLPPSDEYQMRESFARLDRIQVIAKRNLEKPFARLTEDAFSVLLDLLKYHLGGEPDKNLQDYRRMYMEARGQA